MSVVRYPHRIQSVHIESIDGDLSVYDTARQRVHSLNHTAAFVWQRCDGRTLPVELAAALSAEASIDDAEAVVQLTLQELAAAHLLEAPLDEVAPVSRRDLLRRGVAAAAIPAIYSIVAPPPAAAQSAPAPGTVTFAFTGADDSFIVPVGVVSLTIVATGAPGGVGLSVGFGAGGAGGLGGRATATVPVTPGASLTVRVGGVGFNGLELIATPGGFNGGGGSAANGGGGGGSSSVRDGATPLVVAGGGGGGGASDIAVGVGANGGAGGAGGGLMAVSGQIPGGTGGGGGGPITGGNGGFKAAASNGTNGSSGTVDQGGDGGGEFGEVGGGGGGGGYRGGGGGGAGAQLNELGAGGGGGGSSFTAPGATGVVHEQGVTSGAGSVMISW